MSPTFLPPAQTDLLAPFEVQYGAQLIGCTITRIRGLVTVGTIGETNNFGFVRVTCHVADQFQAVRAPVPEDNAYNADSASLDYMMFEPFQAPISGDDLTIDSAPENPGNGPASQRLIDVKSMRRLGELNQSLLLRASARSAIAVPGIQVTYDLSILVALP